MDLTPARTVPEIEGIDVTRGLQLLRGDIARYGRLLRTFARYHAADVAALADTAGPATALAQRLHALKGSAAAVGATGLHERAGLLEQRLREGTASATLAADLHALADSLQALIAAIEEKLPG